VSISLNRVKLQKLVQGAQATLELVMPGRQKHQQEVRVFLQKHFPIHDFAFSLPEGSGMETYFVQAGDREYFVKVGASIERYLALAEIGLTPPILASGQLESGLPIIVQPLVSGRKPSQRDFQDHLGKVAECIQQMHNHPQLKKILLPASSRLHKEVGLQALDQLRKKWERYKAQVPSVAGFVDRSLDSLAEQISLFTTEGLVASHNDICNANWLFASDGKVCLVDFESMSLDDPARDLGALLWWYYPPERRKEFLELAGYRYDHEFGFRMRVRMSMHCLDITLPRAGSFDRFVPEHYSDRLEDFRACLEGEENPQGYGWRNP
jgi:thiamine kinase-like enzyme